MMQRVGNIAIWLLMLLLAIGMLTPLWWMVIGAFAEDFTTMSIFDNIRSLKLTWDNFRSVVDVRHFGTSILNSAVVGLVVTVGNMVFCLMVAYALARHHFRGKKVLSLSVIAVLMIPVHIVIIPLFLLVSKLGIYDTHAALILPFLVNPLGIALLTQYIIELPSDLEEAARLDGASELRILFSVVAPLCKPALAVLAVQVFMTNWNSFLLPFILTTSDHMRTLPVMLTMLQGYQQIEWQQLFAASTISTVPVIVVYLFFQRQIVSGITAGALKS